MTRFYIWQFIVFTSLTFNIATVFADKTEPMVFCSKPVDLRHLAVDKGDYEFQQMMFETDVDRYKSCITDFIESQQDAIDIHQNAIQGAYDEWNSFIKISRLK